MFRAFQGREVGHKTPPVKVPSTSRDVRREVGGRSKRQTSRSETPLNTSVSSHEGCM